MLPIQLSRNCILVVVNTLMVKDYKLCPKCNNALDNNVMQCPYCGENL